MLFVSRGVDRIDCEEYTVHDDLHTIHVIE